jgi:photoactive yellow protein
VQEVWAIETSNIEDSQGKTTDGTCQWCGLNDGTDESGASYFIRQPCYDRIIGLSAVYKKQLDGLPFGVIELDAEGTVTAYNRAEAALAGTQADRVMGRNFFTEVAPCTAVKEFEGRFRHFLDSDERVAQFSFTFSFRDGPVGVEIFLLHCDARVDEEQGGVVSASLSGRLVRAFGHEGL